MEIWVLVIWAASNFTLLVLKLGNRDSGDQLNGTTASCIKEAEGEYIVGSSEINSYELRSLTCRARRARRKLLNVVSKFKEVVT